MNTLGANFVEGYVPVPGVGDVSFWERGEADAVKGRSSATSAATEGTNMTALVRELSPRRLTLLLLNKKRKEKKKCSCHSFIAQPLVVSCLLSA